MTTTFYRKYRPQKLSELDSIEPREELIRIFKSGKYPHAFLFSGPKGIGKTSAARIVAKTVDCEKPKNFEPCNECTACISITAGTNVDVLEIDAASNRGIDDIKELREKIKLAPASLKYKVYIIDEVHMLTTEAFNALLKTLEEPPKHAIFILCTTDPEKLPKTITSRCLIVNFKRASKTEIIGKLKRICELEPLEYEEKALEEIVKISDGSFRDANKVLEQVSFSGKITEEEVKKLSGLSRDFSVDEILFLLEKRATRESLLWINKAVEQGINPKVLTEKILERLRLLLLSYFGVEEPTFATSLIFSPQEFKILIDLFTRAYSESKFAVIPQLPLEMAVVEWSSYTKVSEDKNDKGEAEARTIKAEKKEDKVVNDKEQDNKTKETNKADKVSNATSSFSLEDVLSKWPEILEKVKPLNHSVLAFLKATRPLNCEGGFLVLEVFYKFHKDQLEKEQCRRIFEQAAGEVLDAEVKLKCCLNETPRPVKQLPKVELHQPIEAKPTVTKLSSQNPDQADIIALAEEIFNKEGVVQ